MNLQELTDDLAAQVVNEPERAIECVYRLMAENYRLRWALAQAQRERDAAVSMLTAGPLEETA